jgi:protein-disulfide isomerase/uncharacterized membrane protein
MNEPQESSRQGSASGRGNRVVFLVFLALVGAWISLMLTNVHLSHGQSRSAVFRLVCKISGGGCEQVLESPWATLPGNIPLALLGLAYFSAIAVWYLVVGRANRAGRSWFVPIFVLQLAGGLVSLLLLALMLAQMRALCGWCALVHGINLVLLGVAWKLWPRERSPVGGPAWPPARLGAAALLLVVAVAGLWMQWLGNRQLQTRARSAREEVERYRGDADLMRYLYSRNRPQVIPIRSDEAVLGSGSAPHTVVVFSDFQCPGCQDFAAFFEREVLPSLGGRLRLVYKHFPLDTDCNPKLPRAFHANACEAAHAAEAARELGGPQGFWKMHHALFESPAEVTEGRWAELASSAGLDGAAVAERVARRTQRDRIAEDVRLGYALKLNETPSVFVDGRLLEDWTNLDLWKAILATPAATPQQEPAAAAALSAVR